MLRIAWVGTLTGCQLVGAWLPAPYCQHQIVVTDVATGAIDLELDADPDCVERGFPNGARWDQLLTDDLAEPLRDERPSATCDPPAREILGVWDIPPDELAVDPTTELPGTVVQGSPEDLVDGAWVQIFYFSEGEDLSVSSDFEAWSAWLRLGVEGSVLYGTEHCE